MANTTIRSADARAATLRAEIDRLFAQPGKRRLKQNEALAVLAKLDGLRNHHVNGGPKPTPSTSVAFRSMTPAELFAAQTSGDLPKKATAHWPTEARTLTQTTITTYAKVMFDLDVDASSDALTFAEDGADSGDDATLGDLAIWLHDDGGLSFRISKRASQHGGKVGPRDVWLTCDETFKPWLKVAGARAKSSDPAALGFGLRQHDEASPLFDGEMQAAATATAPTPEDITGIADFDEAGDALWVLDQVSNAPDFVGHLSQDRADAIGEAMTAMILGPWRTTDGTPGATVLANWDGSADQIARRLVRMHGSVAAMAATGEIVLTARTARGNSIHATWAPAKTKSPDGEPTVPEEGDMPF